MTGDGRNLHGKLKMENGKLKIENGKWKQVVKVEARAVSGDAAGRKSMDNTGCWLCLSTDY